MSVLLLVLNLAHSAPGDGLPALAHNFYAEGLRRQSNGDWRGAALRFEKVVQLVPDYTPAWCRLGDTLYEDGRVSEATGAWNGAPYDPDCVEALGRAELDRARYPEALARFTDLSRLTSTDPRVELLIALAEAGMDDPDAAVESVHRYLGRGAGPSDDLPEAIEAIAARLEDEPEVVLELIDAAVAAQPQLAERLEGVRHAFKIEVRAVEQMGAAPVALNSEQIRQLQQARRRFGEGDGEEALRLLEKLRDEATRSPEVWAALADVREHRGDIRGAEYAMILARTLDPQRSGYHARLGSLLATRFGGRFDAEALAELERASEGRPDPDLVWCGALLAGRLGQFERMDRALDRYADLAPGGTPSSQRCALPTDPEVLAEDLARERADPPVLPAVEPPPGVDAEAWLGVHRAQVHLDQNELDQAMAEVNRALVVEPALVKGLNLKGHLLTMGAAYGAAAEVYERSLAASPEQGDVMAALSELYRRLGRDADARTMRDKAAAARSPVARFLLAKDAADQRRWWEARSRLDGYFEVATSGAVHSQAIALRQSLNRTIRGFWLVVVLVLGGGISLPLIAAFRRRSGSPLSVLLARSPRVFREVAGIVSSIRHEVLKHNISALPGVADALESGDPEPARWMAERLFGQGGAVRRFHLYIDQLSELGRSRGVRLNLRVRDPVFGPLIAAMDRLSAMERRLVSGRVKPEELRSVSDSLNQEGFAALGELLQGVCVVELKPPVFQAALDAVLAEPAFRGVAVPEWVLDVPETLSVRVFRDDLHDILVNLLRNALEASIQAGCGRLGVRLDIEEDDITGIERVEIRVADDAPRRISTAMIRGRYIERGLGLAVDLTSRAGGSIHVEDEPGWSKAVVVRLPLAEGGGT